jgi:hypothetical protein
VVDVPSELSFTPPHETKNKNNLQRTEEGRWKNWELTLSSRKFSIPIVSYITTKTAVFRFIISLPVLKITLLLKHYVRYRGTSYTANQKPMNTGIRSVDLDQHLKSPLQPTPYVTVQRLQQMENRCEVVNALESTTHHFAAGNQQLRILLVSLRLYATNIFHSFSHSQT